MMYTSWFSWKGKIKVIWISSFEKPLCSPELWNFAWTLFCAFFCLHFYDVRWLCCNIKIYTFSLYCYYFHVKLQLSNGILCIILFSLIVASDFICKICYKCTKYVIRIKYIVHVLYLKHFSNSETDTCTVFEV